MYPKVIYVENLGDDLGDDFISRRYGTDSLGDAEDEITIACYKFEKMVVVRREEKITVTDA